MNVYIICLLLIIYICGSEISHRIERKDLYNRIMSKDISEYKSAFERKGTVDRKSAHQKAIEKWKKDKTEL